MKRLLVLYALCAIPLISGCSWFDHDHDEDHDHTHTQEHDHDTDTHHGHNHAEEGHDDHDDDVIRLSTKQIEEFGIELATAGPGRLLMERVLPGSITVNEDRRAHIVPRYAGLVLDVHASVGDTVEKGDTLAVLESNESLVPYNLTSLIGGVVVARHLTVGESKGPEHVAFVVADLSTVWVDLTVYQRDIPHIRTGQTALIQAAHDQPMATGTISYVSRTLDEHTRTASARVTLPNPDGRWKPGLFVNARISVTEEDVGILAPLEALQSIDGQTVVFVLSDEGFEPRAIRTGRGNSSSTEVLDGLRVGERYVSRNGFILKSEMERGTLEHAGHAH